MHRLLKYLIIIGSVFIIFCAVINIYIVLSVKKHIYYQSDKMPPSQTALVLGAGIFANGQISDMFLDRLDTAVDLYNQNKIKKILVSGDHGRQNYDEVNKAKDYLLSKGISGEDIFLDHAGFDTYDSIYRAKEIFQVDSLIIITQDFHLPRALYVANQLEIKSVGLSADRHEYLAVRLNYLREIPARVKTWLEIVFNSSPQFLGDRIPITGDSKKSWDKN
ncbi:MAG: hypothetical protein COU31_02305 [Candidatus Magasanikbacteria bacterium CG10_big_fil_rev_8_21_14_0_10_40_10]|uniref:DUF218 domain-containing protein n=1 Tax=Candidatus Magasanikbacteria bacterium CG10_big_fil_rev_8_21_14_0_10_40_10 TaxID=1974648 RepID=A0A2M6W421_9BACT|nr:MAG: hypothetical protein COU31_02305 [Candidatus Magasanikbacteria bacterium CG10_big_fil_rev_8_21_14_0_10_40_10]